MTDQARFRGILGGLAEDGWHGEAGPEFVELIGEVLSAKSSTLECSGDCVSEAVLVVAGCGGGDLGVFAARLLAMDNPLGYVITSVATNLDRAAVEDVMGVGSRQVGPGVEAVTRFSELSRADDGDGFDHVLMRDAWARGVAGGSVATFQWCSWASGGVGMRRGVLRLRLSWCRTCCRPRPRPGGPSSSGRRSWCRSPRRCPSGGCRAHGSGRHGRRHRGQVSREIASAVCASTKGYRRPTTHLVCSRNPNRSPRATRLTNSPCLFLRTGPEFRGSSLEILTTLESAASLTQG